MVARSTTRRRIMKEFEIAELGAVDDPAQAPALAVIMKRASTNKDAAADKNYYDGAAYPTHIAECVQAVDFETVLAEQQARAAAAAVGDELREKWCALQQSFCTIASDESVSAQDKITQMQQSLQQYIDSLSEQSTEIAESMTKALAAAPAVAELLKKHDPARGDSPMTDAEKKQLGDLQKKVDELTSQLAAATADDHAKKAAELQKALDAAKAKTEELEAAIKKAEEDGAEAAAKAAMSDAEKEYAGGLDDDARKEFMGMSSDDRKKQMKKSADEDPVIYKAADGTEYHKSDGDKVAKLAKRNDELAKQAADEIGKRETAELTKRAEDEPYKFYKGETADKVAVLRAVSKIEDEGIRKNLEDMLEVGGKAIAAAFDKVGHSREEVAKSAMDFNKRVDEIAARDKISKVAARKKARVEFPDELAASQEASRASGN